MTNQHPITPPPELVKQWWKDAQQTNYSSNDHLLCCMNYVATQTAHWGAGKEREACITWLRSNGYQHIAFELNDFRNKSTTHSQIAND